MLGDNPLLTILGRSGRGRVVAVLLAAPGKPWTVRELARAGHVDAMTASRSVRELAAVGAVERLRPGRDARVTWVAGSVAARALAELAGRLPDLRRAVGHAFAAAYTMPGVEVRLWQEPNDDLTDPLCPTRVALVVADDAAQDDMLDAAGPALDAVRRAGLPAPDVLVVTAADLDTTAVQARAGLLVSAGPEPRGV